MHNTTDYKADALSVADAQRIIEGHVTPLQAAEKAHLSNALGRILAEDIISPISVPAHDNSAMDGFALCGGDLRTGENLRLKIVGAAYAGRPYSGTVATGECVRIMTGAVIPRGCDTVVAQEITQPAADDSILIPAGCCKPGDNRRLRGEDLAAGAAALRKGRILRPADLGLLASLGVAEASVQRPLRVAVFSTGDELRAIGETLDEGCVYDSNRYTLLGMLQRLGCEVVDLGLVRDNREALTAVFRQACESADAVITSGGVSVGDVDYTRQIMSELGEVAFWNIAMRPGRPMAFGKISSNGKSAYLFGLPGNPVAVMVTFYFFVRAALLRLMGAEADAPPLMQAVSQTAIRKKPGRTEYQRGCLSRDVAGKPQVRITGSQGSGVLRSMSEANCMVILGHEQAEVHAGDMVDVIAFDGLV